MPQRAPQHHPSHYRPYKAPPRPRSTWDAYRDEWREIRKRVLAEEGFCYLCGGLGRDDDEVDHVIALDRGGTNDRSNLRRAHIACHSRKTVKEDGGFGNERKQQ